MINVIIKLPVFLCYVGYLNNITLLWEIKIGKANQLFIDIVIKFIITTTNDIVNKSLTNFSVYIDIVHLTSWPDFNMENVS